MKIHLLAALALAGALVACSDESSSTTAPLAPSPTPGTAAGFSDSGAIEPTRPPDVAGTEGVVRNARMDAAIAKPVILQVSRISDTELSVQFAVSSTADINDYRVQWGPGCITGYNRKLGAESIFHTPTPMMTQELVSFRPGGGQLTHRAFKVRIRARKAANTATERKGGPWSDEVLLYPENPASTDPDQPPCTVGLTSTAADYCPLIINGLSADWEINAALRAELDPSGPTRIREAHADGAVIEHRGFRAEARTSPNRWVIVSLDQVWRTRSDSCRS